MNEGLIFSWGVLLGLTVGLFGCNHMTDLCIKAGFSTGRFVPTAGIVCTTTMEQILGAKP